MKKALLTTVILLTTLTTAKAECFEHSVALPSDHRECQRQAEKFREMGIIVKANLCTVKINTCTGDNNIIKIGGLSK